MSLYNEYESEADFRQMCVRPFLMRMGFQFVEETHGAQELGHDFIFSEQHPVFGHRTYAAVVKHARKINTGRSVDEVLTQVKQAFNKQAKRAYSPRPVQASLVIVINSGEITETARNQLWDALLREKHSDNVVFMDGNTLQALTGFTEATTTRRRFSIMNRLGAELDFNKDLVNFGREALFKGEAHIFTFKLTALEEVFSHLDIMRQLDRDELFNIWNTLTTLQVMSAHAFTIPAKYNSEHIDSLGVSTDATLRRLNKMMDKLLKILYTPENQPTDEL